MKKKSAVICLICVICVPWLLASCVKDELHDTPHPDQGVVSVSVDYPQGAEEGDYTVEVDGKPLDEGDNASNPLTPGEHTVLVYNTPEGFTVTDGIAYVERVDGTRALTDLIDPLPETLYSGTKTVTVVADDTLHLDLSVAQRTRDLRASQPSRAHSPAWRELTTCAVKRFMARRSAPVRRSPEAAARWWQTCACSARWARRKC